MASFTFTCDDDTGQVRSGRGENVRPPPTTITRGAIVIVGGVKERMVQKKRKRERKGNLFLATARNGTTSYSDAALESGLEQELELLAR